MSDIRREVSLAKESINRQLADVKNRLEKTTIFQPFLRRQYRTQIQALETTAQGVVQQALALHTDRKPQEAIAAINPALSKLAETLENNPHRTAIVQAIEEAQRDIMNTSVTLFTTNVQKEVDRNNFPTYNAQLMGMYEMYEGRSRFGAEMLGAVVDTRSAFIAGEGLSVITKKKKAYDWLNDEFILINNLGGAKLMDLITMSELEGKALVSLVADKYPWSGLEKDKGRKTIFLHDTPWMTWRYTVEYADFSGTLGTQIKRIYYKQGQGGDLIADNKDYDLDKTEYVVIGRPTWLNRNWTPNKLHKVLTQFENLSRGMYDLRKNTHFYGRIIPYWKTQTREDAASINDMIGSNEMQIGDGYAGPADFSLVEPSGSAAAALQQDIMLNLKIISSASGIPVHWLAWPELMSNRSTAENLMEVVNSATRRERLIWERAFRNLMMKALVMAVDLGIGDLKSEDIPDDLEVRLSFNSMAMMEKIITVWQPLVDAGMLSEHTLMSMLPASITWEKEQKLIKQEKDTKAKANGIDNNTVNAKINQMQQNGQPGQVPGQPATNVANQKPVNPAQGANANGKAV